MKRMNVLALVLGSLCTVPAWPADLYQQGQFRSLVSDVRAGRVGDSLTVLVVESSSAASTADTNARRSTDVVIGGTSTSQTIQIGGNIDNDSSGAARTQRAGKLLAQITVAVTAIDPNGDLRVAGEQLLEVNDEKQMIRLEGKVRPQDIGDNNTIVSSRIADAKIHYVGDGVLADGQKIGIVSRVLMWLGL